MVDNKDKKDCCGCGVCKLTCPQKAIKMEEDFKGFKYPVVDKALCNNCGYCDNVCTFNNSYKNNGDNPKVYAAKIKDDEVRSTSTSGGLFTAISDKILENNGAVYGACYGDKLNVYHKRAETKRERDSFKGSKYVQSDLGDTFLDIKKDVFSGRKVLFTGTPCQVASLRKFLVQDYDNLLTVDLVCHGTPSNKLWREYLDIIEKANKDTVVSYNFRDKTNGWHSSKIKVQFKKSNNRKRVCGQNSFYQLFLDNFILMPACYNCRYANYNRPSDITIADYWGIESVMREFDDNKGVSLVLVNTENGESFFESIKDKVIIRQSLKGKCIQSSLVQKPPKNSDSEKLWDIYRIKGLKSVLIKYTDYSIIRTFFRRALSKIKRYLSI